MLVLKNKVTGKARATDRLRALWVAAALGFCLTGSAVAAPVVGTTAAVSGNVFVSTNGAERKAQVRDSIQLNDEVVTKDDSALQILLLDSTTFTVGQNCSMIIDEFVYDPDTSIGKVSASVITGAFRYMSGQIGRADPKNAQVTTPSSVIGIRGTFFEGIVGADALALAQLGGIDTSNSSPTQASITILRGAGGGVNTLDTQGAITVTSGGVTKTIIQPGYAIFSPGPGLPPIGPFPVTQAMLDYLDFFLRSTPNGPGVNPTNVNQTGSGFSGQDQFNDDGAGDEELPDFTEGEGIEDEFGEEMDDDHDDGDDDDGDEKDGDEGGYRGDVITGGGGDE